MNNFDDLKLAVEMLSGGTNTVIFDDIGMPSIMVAVPMLARSELITAGAADAHPGFIVDGNTQSVAYMSKYQNIVQNSRAYSLPMQDPRANITFDQALEACRKKGEGWGVQPAALWSAIALWCKKNDFQPHGNNNFGRDVASTWEKGVVTYTYEDSGTKNGRTATGSGPATWYHNGDYSGIADMNGNVWEWCAGIRLVNGEVQFIINANSILATCDMGASSAEWRALDKDGNFVAPGSANTLKLDYVSSKWKWVTGELSSAVDQSRSCAFKDITADEGVDANAKAILQLMTLMPEAEGEYSGDYFWANNAQAERFLNRGGSWNGGAGAGVFSSSFYNARSSSNLNVGFRSAFYGKL